MNFEPQKFFIGLMDFFSILLPGALLSYAIKDGVGSRVLDRSFSAMGVPEAWLVFFFSSYLLGHYIFLMGSWFDELYDMARRTTQTQRLKELARWGTLRPKWQRFLLWLVFKREKDQAVDRVGAIKRNYLNPLQAADAVNTFQWAKLRLALEKPEVLAPVQRFEADSKFFRSLVVVLLLLPFAVGPDRRHSFAIYWFVFLLLAFWRYMEQRHKASSQAYWAVIALEGHARKIAFPAGDREADEPTHAGGLVYRKARDAGSAKGDVEWLLVEAKADPNKWVLPKGHIEAEENPLFTAVREVREETGVFARIETVLTVSTYRPEGEEKEVRVQYYLMQELEQWKPTDRLRRSKWYSYKAAYEIAYPEANKKLLEAADEKRRWLAGR
ncbi:NUDIX domain-containing protein [Variovorax sp. J31P207]|uniref:NUDIX domain-containing protein n=1 Tax=Variovorax sp. J31P207 TaxID=3053510 RepID=UPI002574A59A|nr:NUDIX domain-containing protein [Variovorax sp. J31P207]MDM0069623.1 NUDIX domain-containing protein [Variovorax sp. J31P207]